ncbi:hypothetical protein [Sulfurospirillum arcachonense]|uniref:hypothetical protein n=1 Tax=Sulfurospirillum arcachonense TaxID=57666 RepID=UPI0004683D19|nr:hypothetical protein [Sulfurospirillum arcachonense]
MEEFVIDLFGGFGRVIVFVHIIGAALLIGSMFTIKFIIEPTVEDIEDETIKYSRKIKILDKYTYFVFIVASSIIMNIGFGFQYASPTIYSLIHVKEALSVFIAFNFAYMYIKLISAKKFFKTRSFFEVEKNLNIITLYLLPLNLLLSLISVYIGLIVRGF